MIVQHYTNSSRYQLRTFKSLDFNPESDTVNPSASITGADGPGVGVETLGAFAASAAKAAVASPRKADPVTPKLIKLFKDCFKLSELVTGCRLD